MSTREGTVRASFKNYQEIFHWYLNRIPSRKRITILVIIYSIVVCFYGIYIDLFYGGRAMPYVLPHITVPLFVAGLLLAALPSIWMPTGISLPSSFLYWGLYLLGYIPALFLTLFKFGSPSVMFVLILSFCVTFLILPFFISPFTLPRISMSERSFWRMMIGLFGVFLGFIFIIMGDVFDFPMSLAIYDIRTEYKASLDTLHPVLERFTVYAVNWLYLVLSPIFFTVGCLRREWRKASIGTLGFLTVFFLTGYKTALLVPISIVVLSFVLKTAQRYFLSYALLGLSVALIGAGILNTVLGIILPASLLRRLIILPGLLTGLYYDFFSTHPFTYFSDRFWGRPFSEYPYDMPVPNMIGKIYFNDPNMHANANLWAEGFAMLGYPGLLLSTLVLAAGFWFYNSVTIEINPHESVLFLTGYIIVITNGDVISLFATNGFAFFLLVVYFYSQAQY